MAQSNSAFRVVLGVYDGASKPGYGCGEKLLADYEVGLILDKYTKAIASQFKPKLP